MEDQRGISSIVGLALVVGLVMTVGLSTYIRDWVPWEQRDKEYNVMHEVQQSFRDMKEMITSLAPGQGGTMSIKMGVEPASAYSYASTGAKLTMSPAKDVGWIRPTVDTHVLEYDNDYANWDNENLSVSPTEGSKAWTFLKFDLRDGDRRDDENILITNGFYDNVNIVSAALFLYVRDLNLRAGEQLQRLELAVPVTVSVYPVENDAAVNDDNLTWDNRHYTQPDFRRALGARYTTYTLSYADEWASFDVTSFVREEYSKFLNNQLEGRPLDDNYVSFCVRGQVEIENTENALARRVHFVSEDAWMYPWYQYKPYLEIVYSRLRATGSAYARAGVVDSGYIQYDSMNAEFPDQTFIYEGGAIILQQYGYYDVMLPGGDPEELIQVTPAEGNNIRVTVKRYRITSEGASWMSGGGWAGLSFTVVNENYLRRAGATPNVAQVEIIIRSDNPRAWRDYLRRLAQRLNYSMGGYWSSYGDYVKYDYSRVSLTIYGKNLDPSTSDIYYTEKVIDVDVALG